MNDRAVVVALLVGLAIGISTTWIIFEGVFELIDRSYHCTQTVIANERTGATVCVQWTKEAK